MLGRRRAVLGYVVWWIATRLLRRAVRRKVAAVMPRREDRRWGVLGGLTAAAVALSAVAAWRRFGRPPQD